MKATAEYATANIAVWWDMKDCPIPEGYEAGRVRSSLEAAFKEQGYSGPVSITAYGDQTQTPDHILKGLLSTGVSVAHNRSESTSHLIYEDLVEWRGRNPPPATMMIISDEVGDKFTWDLVRLQQRTLYNLFLAYSIQPNSTVLSISEEWCWKKLLKNNISAPLAVCVQGGAKFYCKSCNYNSGYLKKFKKHLSSYNHAREEVVNPTHHELIRYTEDWGRNYKATPKFATAKIQVWWDMFDCPIPQGYNARQVRPSIEAAVKELGYSGPVSITAYGDHKHTPLRALSSTGVDIAHTIPDVTYTRMFDDISEWHRNNPPQTAAIIMVISDNVEIIASGLVRLLQEYNYNFFLAYSSRPCKTSYLLTSAEWLWESVLEGLLLQKCSSESGSRVSTAMFFCGLCRGFNTKSIDNFRAHLASDEHAQEEYVNPTHHKLIRYTEDWGRNYKATPEFATAKIQVWWDMFDCPIPQGYDARQVRPSIEAAVKELGYFGPVSITAYGDHKHTPLRALSSTGVDIAHTIPDVTYTRMFGDMLEWIYNNPPQTAAIIMLISDNVESFACCGLVELLQRYNYKKFLAYSSRPCKMSYMKMSSLRTSAEWLWESILAASGKRRLILQKFCSGSGNGESTAMFFCRLCRGFNTKSIDNFRAHLASVEHAQEEMMIYEHGEYLIQNKRLFRLAEYDRHHLPRSSNI